MKFQEADISGNFTLKYIKGYPWKAGAGVLCVLSVVNIGKNARWL